MDEAPSSSEAHRCMQAKATLAVSQWLSLTETPKEAWFCVMRKHPADHLGPRIPHCLARLCSEIHLRSHLRSVYWALPLLFLLFLLYLGSDLSCDLTLPRVIWSLPSLFDPLTLSSLTGISQNMTLAHLILSWEQMDPIIIICTICKITPCYTLKSGSHLSDDPRNGMGEHRKKHGPQTRETWGWILVLCTGQPWVSRSFQLSFILPVGWEWFVYHRVKINCS